MMGMGVVRRLGRVATAMVRMYSVRRGQATIGVESFTCRAAVGATRVEQEQLPELGARTCLAAPLWPLERYFS